MTIEEIFIKEKELINKAPAKYGEYFSNTMDINNLLNDFLNSINASRYVFWIFLSQIRIHVLLAIFSTIKLHNTECMMNIRQTLEFGVCAAYAIEHDSKDDYIKEREGDSVKNQELKKYYIWIEKKYKDSSDNIKGMKDLMSKNCHANLIYSLQNVNFDFLEDNFQMNFFDKEDIEMEKINLWAIGNIMIGLMDLFYGVYKKFPDKNIMSFSSNFCNKLNELSDINVKLMRELSSIPRFSKWL